MRTLVLPLGVMVSACNKDEIVWIQLNGKDVVDVQVVDGPVVDDPAVLELTSAVEGRRVGEASVTPSAGPVGTLHEVVVVVDVDHEERVQRVVLVAAAGSRGRREWEMRQDPAFLSSWGIEVQSLGEVGEVRTDEFTIQLFVPDDLAESSEKEGE